MTYSDAIRYIDTLTALSLLGLSTEQSGSYIYFECPECEGKAVAKAWGEKKNLTYCTKCKKSGHIIGLAMKVKKIGYTDAVVLLKKCEVKAKKITDEINLDYELLYNDFLKEKGINEDTCRLLHIGQPKGKSMLAGCIAFTVWNEGKRIAYYGIRMKDEKPIHHHSFSPELYLFALSEATEVTLTTSMFECVRMLQENKTAVCNFGLPYLSAEQSDLLKEKKVMIIGKELVKESHNWSFFHKFV